MNVRLTPEAEAQAEACDAWWRENRDVRDLFARELRDTKARLVSKPKIGTVYTILDGKPMRRVLMRKTGHHVYFVADHDEIIVHAAWGASKEHGPRL